MKTLIICIVIFLILAYIFVFSLARTASNADRKIDEIMKKRMDKIFEDEKEKHNENTPQ